ncbi:MAG: galactose mutarotase, partial [Lachnospiraceae bacterium]|nr:galactose mutarotase [Lachnospiraceae bacterium]
VALGFDKLEGYLTNPPHFGGTIGRNANRIAGGEFQLNGTFYQLEKNNHGNCLHSGKKGYDTRLWKLLSQDRHSVSLGLTSPDMDQGFPGEFQVSAIYSLNDEGVLEIFYEGSSDQDTLVNMTNHSYFNLNGEDSGTTVLSHVACFHADAYTPVSDEKAIPRGTIESVEGTPFDFRTPMRIGDRIDEDFPQLNYCGGYDHNYV